MQTAQLYLFAFLVGIVVGTIAGGVVGDRVGRIPVMWFSILGALPFALMLPYANLFWTGVLAVTVAMIMASAFSAILVYAQELLPGRVGLVAGMFFGFSFGLGGLGAAALGQLADLDQHRHGLQGDAVPAAARPADGLPAAPARRAPAHLTAHQRRPLPDQSLVRILLMPCHSD